MCVCVCVCVIFIQRVVDKCERVCVLVVFYCISTLIAYLCQICFIQA